MKYFIMSLMVLLASVLAIPDMASAESFSTTKSEFFYLTKKTDTWESVGQKFDVAPKRIRAMNPRIKNIADWKEVRIPTRKKTKVSVNSLAVLDSVPEIRDRKKVAVRKAVAEKPKVSYDGPWDWKIPGADPFVGDRSLAFNQLELEPMEIIELEQLIAAKKFSPEKIKSGDYFDIQIYSSNVKQKFVTAAWDENHTEAARVYRLSTGKEIWEPYICHNWSVRLVKIPTKPFTPSSPMEPPVTAVPPVYSPPPAPAGPPEAPSDEEKNAMCEAIAGGGIYEDAHGADHKGGFYWFKGRCYPMETALKNGWVVKTGVVATAIGFGGNDRGFGYYGNEWAIGPSFNIIGEGWDANIDLMFGRLYNNGSISRFTSEQTDNIFLTSIHYNEYHRRMNEELWFPKWEGNIEWRHILSSDVNAYWGGHYLHQSPNKNGMVEATYTQYLYDFNMKNGVRVSPWLKAGLGLEQGGDDKFASIMPGFTVGIDDIDILQVGVMGYKQILDDSNRSQIHPLAVTLDLGGIYKAVRKSNITKPEKGEMDPRRSAF